MAPNALVFGKDVRFQKAFMTVRQVRLGAMLYISMRKRKMFADGCYN